MTKIRANTPGEKRYSADNAQSIQNKIVAVLLPAMWMINHLWTITNLLTYFTWHLAYQAPEGNKQTL